MIIWWKEIYTYRKFIVATIVYSKICAKVNILVTCLISVLANLKMVSNLMLTNYQKKLNFILSAEID